MMNKTCIEKGRKVVYNKWGVLLANTLLFVLMAWQLPINYEANDDVVMCMIANGKFSGIPDGHLVFINALYGWVIAGLYRLSGVLEWYTLCFCIIHILAMSGVVYMIIKEHEMSSLFKGLFLVFVFVIWARIIVAFQYTTTAGFLCFSGCMALLQPNKKLRILGICAVFVASLIRFQAAGLVGVLFAPQMIVNAIKNKRYGYSMVIAGLLALLGHWADGLFYKQPDWAEYRACNAVRVKINDNPNARLLEDVDLPEGVDMEDYLMLCSFEGDPSIMTLTKLQEIKAQIDRKKSYRQVMSNIVFQLRTAYRNTIILLCVGLLLCVIMSFGCRARANDKSCEPDLHTKGLVCALIMSFLLGLIMMAYICANLTLKNRVFLCILLPLSYLLVKSVPYYVKGGIKIFRMLMACVMLCLIVKYANQDKKVIRMVRNSQEEFLAFQAPLLKDKDVKVLYPAAFVMENLSPFRIKDIGFRLVGFGWTSNIPFNKGLLDSHISFVDADIVYYGLANTPSVNFESRIKKNYGVETQLETIGQNQKYALYKIVSKREPNEKDMEN